LAFPVAVHIYVSVARENGMRRVALGLLLWGGLLASAAGQGAPDAATQKTATATFAGGCFWCVEADFDKVAGVISTTSGYIGGRTPNPTYEQVKKGLGGNLCRCGTYGGVRKAVLEAAKTMKGGSNA